MGIVIGNIGITIENIASIQDNITSFTILLAIPLMLFSSDFKSWSLKNAVLALFSGIVAVISTVVALFYILRGSFIENNFSGEQVSDIAGLLCGVYTGGTINLAALKLMLDIPSQTYIIIHSYDMIVSVTYLMFLLGIGIRIFRRIIGNNSDNASDVQVDIDTQDDYAGILKRGNILPLIGAVFVSVLIVAISLGVSFVCTGGINMVIIILLITSLAIAASFATFIRNIKKTFELGMYLILIFSLVVASMADFSKLDLAGGGLIMIYLTGVVFGSLIIQTILSKLLKIDADTMIISSVSLINSPPFVPLIASAMNNKKVIITGIAVGLVGYSIGNYLGFIVSKVLLVLTL